MEREELITALGQLGYPLFTAEKKRIGKARVYDVLDQLAKTKDMRLIEAFPVVLANCAHRGIDLDFRSLLSRYRPNSHKRESLEKLLLASMILLEQEGLESPAGINEIVELLEHKYSNVPEEGKVSLPSGMSVSMERLRNSLRRYATDLYRSQSAREKERKKQQRSFELNLHLSTLFSPKQKEIILKKLHGKLLTKTEQEYYSRTVKRKLEAVADNELRRIALSLTK
jgi:hypothetical protein